MSSFILLVAAIILLCLSLNKVSSKLGIPTLLAFIVLGMLFGTDGIIKIPFDNFEIAEQICSVSPHFHYVLWRVWNQLEAGEARWR